MVYKFTGKGLFLTAAFICIISVVLLPVGLVFLYMAFAAHIRIEEDRFVYKMLTTKEILFKDIKKIKLSRPVDARYKVGYAFVNFATVIPLIIEYGEGKKVRFSLNFFERSTEIAEILQQKTGLQIELPE